MEATFKDMTTPQLVVAWDRTDLSSSDRNKLIDVIVKRAGAGDVDAWPSGPMTAREAAAGLYPDPTDPKFAARLFAKREFYDSRAVAAGVASGTVDPCTSASAAAVFELTPVQRIVSRFMSPRTPYMGLLLFHGVGVGKTCSAVTIAEQFLDVSPKSQVIVVLPQALKDNFRRTIFDADKMRWVPDADGVQTGEWSVAGCTGSAYLERMDLMNNPDERLVRYKIDESRRDRYRIVGYQSFANWIEKKLKESIPAGLTDAGVRRAKEDEILRKLFSDRLIIIDEAHNLRDTSADEGEEVVVPGETAAVGEAAENAGGKALNPFLKRIVLNAEGLRLVLMTATPMYNSAPEILLLLNYLIMNDTKREISALKMSDYFDANGALTPDVEKRTLMSSRIRRYVSYMRGENPFTFPLRLKPVDAVADPVAAWPTVSASKKPVAFTPEEAEALRSMPFVFTEPISGSPVAIALREATSRAQLPDEEGGAVKSRDAMLDARMQMANLTYPNGMAGPMGWESFFQSEIDNRFAHKLRVYRPRPDSDLDAVFQGAGLQAHAPKIHRVVDSVTKAQGISFVYSRYIKSGALPLAVALERAGFQRRLADGRLAPVLTGVTPVAPVCAICGRTQAAGDHSAHPFRPAAYVLLTSEEDISPGFSNLVQQAATWPDDPEWGPLGGNVKVVIGSQVASEGLDLKCIREMHVLDAWYHMNRIDQIVGRAIRYCSHSALRAVESRQGLPPMALNNCLIYLHAVRGAEEGGEESVSNAAGRRLLPAYESADMYAYRIAVGKALKVGEVQRLIKQHAWDCNLEIEAIIFAGLPKRTQMDAQGRTLEDYSLDDQDFTSYCDYQKCKYECAVVVPVEGLQVDMSTYRYADARRVIVDAHADVRALFREKAVVPQAVVREVFTRRRLTDEIITEAIMEIINPRRFQLDGPDGHRGFLVAKAGYVVFQPKNVTDTEIPMVLRFAQSFQLQRRFMDPSLPVLAQDVKEEGVEGEEEEDGAVGTVEELVDAEAAAAAAEDAEEEEGEEGVVAAPKPKKVATADKILGKWMEWVTFVRGGGPLPSYLHATLRIWSWILKRYAAVPDAVAVAFRWWVDTVPTFAERRVLLEAAIQGGSPEMDELRTALGSDLILTNKLNAYRIYNPITRQIEHFCRSTAAPPGTSYSLCDTNMAKIVDKAMGNVPVPITLASVGSVMGFLTNKKDAIVFKTLMLDPTKPKTPSTVGAECGNTSNLGEHHPRIQELQRAAATQADLAPLLVPDQASTWDGKEAANARAASIAYEHMMDITHKPLCLYMEFLTRLLEGRHVGGRRWFLNAVAAFQSGLRGKK
jgi:hypothetical protein